MEQASAPANGILEGDQSIINQIAKCLPKNARPILRDAHLNIRLDETGQLAAVPSFDISISQNSTVELADANLIAQSTLQCAPYTVPKISVDGFRIAADFSSARSF